MEISRRSRPRRRLDLIKHLLALMPRLLTKDIHGLVRVAQERLAGYPPTRRTRKRRHE